MLIRCRSCVDVVWVFHVDCAPVLCLPACLPACLLVFPLRGGFCSSLFYFIIKNNYFSAFESSTSSFVTRSNTISWCNTAACPGRTVVGRIQKESIPKLYGVTISNGAYNPLRDVGQAFPRGTKSLLQVLDALCLAVVELQCQACVLCVLCFPSSRVHNHQFPALCP